MDSQWLKVQFQLNPERSKADLARHLGLEPPAVSKILSGNRQIKAHEYIAMRGFFGLPVDGLDQSGQAMLAPLSAANQSLNDTTHDSHWHIPGEILQKRTDTPLSKIKTFKITERVMEPDFRQNEHVLVDLLDKVPSPSGTYVVSDGFGYMVRFCEFIPKSNPPQIKITARDKSFAEQVLNQEDFEIIGRVIAKLEWV